MTSWLNRFKNLFKSQKEPQSQPDRSQQIQKFIQIIEEDDANSIEEARDWVQSEDIEPLIALYWQLENWQKKRALVDIMQDQYHPDMQKMMLDFLRAPMAEGDEWVELAKAVALGFIDERYDRFMHYYNDRKSLARDVNTVLRKHGMKADPVPKKETPPPKPKPPTTNATKSPNQRLMDGAMAGELTAVKTALQDGASINVGIGGGIYDGCTALIMALMRE
ncbi:MAG: hypothetical protein GY943_33305, partial [Chloroflexi bacterium]|nr:hypothetical protein [Chloroflexota bacterium]